MLISIILDLILKIFNSNRVFNKYCEFFSKMIIKAILFE